MSHKQPFPLHDDGNAVPRLKFWEIGDFLVCPVVGQCTSIEEQRRMLKRTKISAKKMSRYGLHELFVSCAKDENHLSTRVDALLERKYGREAEALLSLENDSFMARYREAFKAGEYRAALWAAAVHPSLPLESQREIFGEVHMAMHLIGDERMRTIRKIGVLEKRIDTMDTRTKEAVGQKRALQKEYDRLKHTLADLEAKIAAAVREKAALVSELSKARNREDTDPVLENRALKKRVGILQQALADTRQRETTLKEENANLISELEQQREATLIFRRETRDIINKMTKLKSCDPDCPAFDLCQKRILIVGGISRMESLYRELIENSNGIFEYHDGYVKNGVKQLESRLKRADVVLCPVNCNSHGACGVVKNLAKKHRKTVHMLSNFSLNAVSNVLYGGDNVQASLN